MKRRVFIAIMASLKLQKWVVEMRPKFNSLPIRWILGKNLHVTLIPPWEEADVEAIMKSLNIFQGGTGQFSINIDTLEFGPAEKKPSLLWLRINPSSDLSTIKAELEHALGRKSEYKDFIPNVTLGRFNPDKFESRWLDALGNEPIAIQEEVTWISLVESVPTESGTQYAVLYQVRL